MTSWSGQGSDELPGYLSEPADPNPRDAHRLRDLLAGAQRATSLLDRIPPARLGTPQTGPRPVFQQTAGFLRLVKLRRSALEMMLDEWWSGAVGGHVVVDRRFELGEPRGGPSRGWSIAGRVRRSGGVHWVPVVVDLWPVHDEWAIMTMTPQTRVHSSARYFRTGHAVLDRLTTTLAATRAGRAP